MRWCAAVKIVILTHSAMGQVDCGTSPDDVIWAQVGGYGGFGILPVDVQAGRDIDPGANTDFISVRGVWIGTMQTRWEPLVENATIRQPIGAS